MASLFISYSRKNIEAARKLTEAFKGKDLDFWIDWEGIPPTVDWWQEIEKGIEEADIFLFLISPDSCKSKVCKQEIGHAIKNGKRLIPVVVSEVKGEDAPAELSHLNWIFIRETDDFDPAFAKLITAIKTDYAWAQTHRALQVKALDWEKSGHENSFLLFGKELQDAEFQLATNTSKEPHPTDLQREYVHKSRQAVDRRRVRNAGITTAGLIALAALAIFGFVQAANATTQANIAEAERVNAITEANGRATAQANAEANQKLAEERAIIARSRELVARSLAFQENQFQLSLLLGIEASKTADTPETRRLLLSNTLANLHLAGYIDIQDTVWGGARIALSPDGKILATEGPNHTIILWDLERREAIGQPLKGHAKSVTSLAFSPDGTKLVSGGANPPVILWDLASHPTIATPLLVNTDSEVTSVVFGPDNDTFASVTYGYEDNFVMVWDVKTLDLKARFPASTIFNNPGSPIAFSPDGKILASAGCGRVQIDIPLCAEGEIIFTDTATFQTIAVIHGHTDGVSHLAFSPDGTALASSADNTIIFWDLESNLPEKERLRVTNGTILDIAFSPDGTKLASGNSDNTVILWDLDFDPPATQVLQGHSGFVRSVVFSYDRKQLISAGCEVGSDFVDCNQSEILVWDVKESNPIAEKIPYDRESLNVAFSPNGDALAAGYTDMAVILWDMTKHHPIGQPLKHPDSYLSDISYSPDGKILATAGGNDSNSIILWDTSTHKTLGKLLTGSNGQVTALEFSPDGMILASAHANTIQIWDVTSRKPIGAPIDGLGAYSLSFSPDGKVLAFGSCKVMNLGLCESVEVILWDIGVGRPLRQPLVGGQYGLVNSLAFSPNGKILAAATGGDALIIGETAINLWDIASGKLIGKPIKPVPGKFGPGVTSIAFNPDGKTMAVGMSWGGVILWDVTTRLPIANSLVGELVSISDVAFSPDGSTLAIATPQGVTTLNLDHVFWIEKTCQRASRNFTTSEWSQFFPDEEYRITCPQWPAGK